MYMMIVFLFLFLCYVSRFGGGIRDNKSDEKRKKN